MRSPITDEIHLGSVFRQHSPSSPGAERGRRRRVLRVRAEITSHFRIPSLGHLQPLLIRKILDITVLCLRSCSIVAAESDPNLGAKTHPHDEMIGPSPVKLFLREPLGSAVGTRETSTSRPARISSVTGRSHPMPRLPPPAVKSGTATECQLGLGGWVSGVELEGCLDYARLR
jgi:hypothetical protein